MAGAARKVEWEATAVVVEAAAARGAPAARAAARAAMVARVAVAAAAEAGPCMHREEVAPQPTGMPAARQDDHISSHSNMSDQMSRSW